ncbi:aldolase/citrate lyase family protein [Rhodohalobacter sulfatireducens]|uniref:Aldolase/citrate lyase family protein n=1 Tax=Rhodohalobacter sulfatireducens TaxID=2911366 RepID=A0ABS9KA77_9BACT|nr:aldolase/citrate lyase family protein [Rhodohalobacter sulfatireducens]MCG2587749.1 aldolase/citrate lyase family protein [Rhodohalobacter sulfatireducens]
MTVFFFIKYFLKDFHQYFDKISNCNAIFTFDLEDSLLEIGSESKTSFIKQKYRDILRFLLCNYPAILKYPIAVRVNHPDTIEFQKDLAVLETLNFVNWNTIILPKIESSKSVSKAISDLKSHQVNFENIGILIESEKGVINLNNIIKEATPDVKYVFFGHADYNLDRKILPFKHQLDEEYWDWVQRLLDILQSEDLTFINSPCLYLKDKKLFLYNLHKLSQFNFKKIGQLTLSLEQSFLCQKTSGINRSFSNLKKRKEKRSVVKYARELTDIYKDQSSEKSFSISENHYLICPQEYKMANEFLKARTWTS